MKTYARAFLPLSLLFLLLVNPLDQVSAASLGQWTSTTDYPIHVAGDSCATYSDYVYCVGGFDSSGRDYDDVYYAQLSPSGIGGWSAATPYPDEVDSATCFTGSANIYCVGGESDNTRGVLSDVYTAPISPSGLGGWSSAAPFPHAIAAASCVVYNGYVYCVGGFNGLGEGSTSTYYASVSSGLGAWTSTTPYPFSVYTVPCVEQSGYIYCIGGQQENLAGGTGANTNFPTTEAYYAPLSPSGIGSWSTTSAYPQALSSPSCVANSGDAFCLGGYSITEISNSSVYSSEISSSGVGPWSAMSQYPVPFDLSSCVSDFSNVYCIGGRSLETSGLSILSSVYFAAVTPEEVTNSTSSSSTANSSSSASASSSSTASSTAPEFPTVAALPFVLAACLVVVAILRPAKLPAQSDGASARGVLSCGLLTQVGEAKPLQRPRPAERACSRTYRLRRHR
jgi:hypothetical protein